MCFGSKLKELCKSHVSFAVSSGSTGVVNCVLHAFVARRLTANRHAVQFHVVIPLRFIPIV